MSDELEKILEKLKEETSSFDDFSKNIIEDSKHQKDNSIKNEQLKRNLAAYSSVDIEKKVSSKFNVVWSENKETLIFFMIISVIVIFAGLISGFEYITFAGVVSFILSSVIMFITFYRYIIAVSSKVSLPDGFVERIYELENKVGYIMKKTASGGVDNKIAEEISEIKSIIKVLMSDKHLR